MDIYLVQHGEAKQETEDPERPLTAKGKEEVSRVANHLAKLNLGVLRIVHSGKLRARQTAEILSQHLRQGLDIAAAAGLSPMDEPKAARDLVEGSEGGLMLVGHLPHLSRLASSLVAGDQGVELITFRMGGVTCLTNDGGGWRIRWVLTPETVAS